MRIAHWVVCGTLFTAVAQAQWLDYKTPGIPRTADGKPNLSAPAPKALDGKPDLSGVWMHDFTPIEEMRNLIGAEAVAGAEQVDVPGMEFFTIHKYVISLMADFKPQDAPLTQKGRERAQQIQSRRDPTQICQGVPFFTVISFVSEPLKIVQSPGLTVTLYEVNGLVRQIHSDGRKLPSEINLPANFGYSAGRWEGDSFVVETTGFIPDTFMDGAGTPHSENLHVTERFRRRDFGHLDVEMTFDDPENYTRPFTIKFGLHLLADQDIFEMSCDQNEKDQPHMRKP